VARFLKWSICTRDRVIATVIRLSSLKVRMLNPYDPSRLVSSAPGLPGSKLAIVLLVSVLVVTLLLATKNAIDEQNNTRLTLIAISFSVVSQLPGIVFGYLRLARPTFRCRMMLVPAYFMALTGCAAYFGYAVNGKADSLNSAAHLHIVFFPMLHCFFGLLLYGFFAILAMFIGSGADTAGQASSSVHISPEHRTICDDRVLPDDDMRCPICRWPL
jgi:hypothetical protein